VCTVCAVLVDRLQHPVQLFWGIELVPPESDGLAAGLARQHHHSPAAGATSGQPHIHNSIYYRYTRIRRTRHFSFINKINCFYTLFLLPQLSPPPISQEQVKKPRIFLLSLGVMLSPLPYDYIAIIAFYLIGFLFYVWSVEALLKLAS
jgi:hypothetical protein